MEERLYLLIALVGGLWLNIVKAAPAGMLLKSLAVHLRYLTGYSIGAQLEITNSRLLGFGVP